MLNTSVFIIRTKLQLIFADTIRRIHCDGEKTTFILTASSAQEVLELKQMTAEILSKTQNSVRTIMLRQSHDFFIYVARLFFLLKVNTKGKSRRIFVASIDCARIATAVNLSNPTSVETFDDGSANYSLKSLYFRKAPTHKNLRTFVRNVVFPRGPQGFFRKSTCRHYTAYRGAINIVEKKKRTLINVEWTDYALSDDKKLLRKQCDSFILGTAFQEAGLIDSRIVCEKLAPFATAKCLPIAHPRSFGEAVCKIKFHRLKGCAEPLICEALKRRKMPVGVVHFGSSVAYTLAGIDGLYFTDLFKSCRADK